MLSIFPPRHCLGNLHTATSIQVFGCSNLGGENDTNVEIVIDSIATEKHSTARPSVTQHHNNVREQIHGFVTNPTFIVTVVTLTLVGFGFIILFVVMLCKDSDENNVESQNTGTEMNIKTVTPPTETNTTIAPRQFNWVKPEAVKVVEIIDETEFAQAISLPRTAKFPMTKLSNRGSSPLPALPTEKLNKIEQAPNTSMYVNMINLPRRAFPKSQPAQTKQPVLPTRKPAPNPKPVSFLTKVFVESARASVPVTDNLYTAIDDFQRCSDITQL